MKTTQLMIVGDDDAPLVGELAARRLGAARVIPKPFDVATLASEIRRIIARP